MGISNFFNKQALKLQNNQSAQMERLCDGVMAKKAAKLKAEGKPLTLENLMSKWEALGKVGLSYDDVKTIAEKYVSNAPPVVDADPRSALKAKMEAMDLVGKVRTAAELLSTVSPTEGRKKLYMNIKAEFMDSNEEQRQKLFDDYTNCKPFMELWENYGLDIHHLQGLLKGRGDGR